MNEVLDILSKRTEFLSLLERDIAKNETLNQDIQKKLKSLEETYENIKTLSTQPEHTALIPVCKRLYMPATIVHTGEYLVSKKAHPNGYTVLKTLDQTLDNVKARITEQRELVDKADMAVTQLLDRKKLLLGQAVDELVSSHEFTYDPEYPSIPSEVEAMPNEIKSEKGVAVKVGEFFDILEYEEAGKNKI